MTLKPSIAFLKRKKYHAAMPKKPIEIIWFYTGEPYESCRGIYSELVNRRRKRLVKKLTDKIYVDRSNSLV